MGLPPASSQTWRGAVYGISAASIWGSMYVVSDLTLLVLPPFTLLSLRIVLGLALLLPLWRRQARGRLPLRLRMQLLAVGLLGIGVSLGAQFIGTDLSTAIHGAIITSASPAFVLLFAVALLGEVLTGTRLAAIALAFTGLIIVLAPGGFDLRADQALGDLFLAVAAVSWGLYSVLVRKLELQQPLPPLTVTVYALAGGLGMALPASLLELALRPVGVVDGAVLLAVLYLGFVCTAGALLLWNRAFALVPATVASLFFFAQPLSGAVLAVVFLQQAMTVELWIGAVCIVTAVLLSLRSANSPAAA